MNRRESLIGAFRFTSQALAMEAKKRAERIRGKDQTRILYYFIYSHYARQAGVKKGSSKEQQVKQVANEISAFWFSVDAAIDKDAVNNVNVNEVLNEGNALLDNKDGVGISDDIKQAIQEMEYENRKKAYKTHKDYMAGFSPGTSSFEDVLEYRRDTSGLLAETIGRGIAIASETDQDIPLLLQQMRVEAMCLQFGDDLVDSIVDHRKQSPNLFNALLIEFPSEMEAFEEVSTSTAVLDKNKPYQIIKKYAPQTLTEYEKRFKTLAATLPRKRRRFVYECMALSSHLSYTPNATVFQARLADVVDPLKRRTKIN